MLQSVPRSISPAQPGRNEALSLRIAAEFREMPGTSLTEAQARRLFNLPEPTCAKVLSVLVNRGVLRRSEDGQYRRADIIA